MGSSVETEESVAAEAARREEEARLSGHLESTTISLLSYFPPVESSTSACAHFLLLFCRRRMPSHFKLGSRKKSPFLVVCVSNY